MADANPQTIAGQLKSHSSILIIVGGAPAIDSLGSGLALSMALADTGKNVSVVTKNPVRAEHSRLVGVDKVEAQVSGQKSFVISLPNAVDSIEKVSCYAEGQKLNIVLQPYADVKDFNPGDIAYAKVDGNFEAVVLIDVANMPEVQSVLGEQSQLLQQVPTYAIGKRADNHAQFHFADNRSLAISQMVLQVINALQAPIHADTAINLMQGIYEATDDFHSPAVTPAVFEDAAKLLAVVHKETGRVQSPVAPPLRSESSAGQVPVPSNRPSAPMTPMPQPRPAGSSPLPPLPRVPSFAKATEGQATPAPIQPMQRPAAPQPAQRTSVMREWEIEEDFEFDKAPDQRFGNETGSQAPRDLRQRPHQQMPTPNREGFASRVQPTQGQQQPQHSKHDRHSPLANPTSPQATSGQRATVGAGQNRNKPPQEDDWLSPKIYKTEDLL